VQTGIRWGIDAEHRAALGLPGFRENTWRAGLDRLLLGYALPGDGRTLFAGILPVREVEGALALMLGRFVEFAEALFAQVPTLAAPRPLPQWEHAFRTLLHTFFDDGDEAADEVRRLRDIFGAIGRLATDADFAEPVTFDVVRAHLGEALANTDSGLGFLAGAVTFCALKPMRAIPFQVICLLGMNDTAFPRRDPGLAFDRVASEPRRGDRSQRDDDRHLFLEALLSARAVLHLSYSGFSPRDNSAAPPSVLVSELLDYLAENYALPASDLREALVTRHKLQAFSPAYFREDSPLFSYSAENAHAAAASQQPRTNIALFAATPLAAPGPEWLAVDVDQLAEFFAHPAKFFAKYRLRLALPEEFAPLDESEPLDRDGLDRYDLDQELTRLALAGHSPASHLPVVRAGGLLPHGYAGDSQLGAMSREAETFAARIRTLVSGPPLPPRSIDATLGGWRLTGTLHGLHASALLRHRAATLKGKDLLRAWIHHLTLQLGDAGPHETLLFGRDTAWRFAAIDDPCAILTDLLTLYRAGLQTPLPLFPNTSLEYARRTLQPGARETADPVIEARKKWDADENRPGAGEQEDRWFQLCFPPDPLDAAWKEIALRVFAPILAARLEMKA
jgi:exodeoxyribonuclease V gamma subunit